MGIFDRKKNTKEISNEVPVANKKSSAVSEGELDLSRVIIRPRVSEKAAIVAENANAYIFDVDPKSTKKHIGLAIEQIYKVKPIKISVAKVADKKVRIRGERKKTGVKSGGKKAFVYLKKGERIEFI